MLLSSLGQSYIAGAGIDIHAGNEIAITDEYLARVAGAIQEVQRNTPDGFAGLDAQSTIFAAIRVLAVDHDIADELIPREGELLITKDTKELRFGDGLKTGGFRAGLNSKNMIYVGGDGTALDNGAALVAAYALAINSSPNGMAKSAINKMYILCGCGIYDTAGLLQQTTPFIEIIGLDMYGCRLKFGSLYSIPEACYDFGWRNFTFYKDGTTFNWQWRFTDQNPVNIYFENIRFEGIATDTVHTAFSRTSGASSVFNGIMRNVKTLCSQLLSSSASVGANHTNNIIFDNCEAGIRYIAPTSTPNLYTFAGTMRNCVWTNTSLCSFNQAATTVLHNTKFGMPLNFCVSGSRITYCRFVPVAGVASLKANVAGQTPYIAHCELSATGIDATNIANAAGATAALACNVLSDN